MRSFYKTKYVLFRYAIIAILFGLSSLPKSYADPVLSEDQADSPDISEFKEVYSGSFSNGPQEISPEALKAIGQHRELPIIVINSLGERGRGQVSTLEQVFADLGAEAAFIEVPDDARDSFFENYNPDMLSESLGVEPSRTSRKHSEPQSLLHYPSPLENPTKPKTIPPHILGMNLAESQVAHSPVGLALRVTRSLINGTIYGMAYLLIVEGTPTAAATAAITAGVLTDVITKYNTTFTKLCITAPYKVRQYISILGRVAKRRFQNFWRSKKGLSKLPISTEPVESSNIVFNEAGNIVGNAVLTFGFLSIIATVTSAIHHIPAGMLADYSPYSLVSIGFVLGGALHMVTQPKRWAKTLVEKMPMWMKQRVPDGFLAKIEQFANNARGERKTESLTAKEIFKKTAFVATLFTVLTYGFQAKGAIPSESLKFTFEKLARASLNSAVSFGQMKLLALEIYEKRAKKLFEEGNEISSKQRESTLVKGDIILKIVAVISTFLASSSEGATMVDEPGEGVIALQRITAMVTWAIARISIAGRIFVNRDKLLKKFKVGKNKRENQNEKHDVVPNSALDHAYSSCQGRFMPY